MGHSTNLVNQGIGSVKKYSKINISKAKLEIKKNIWCYLVDFVVVVVVFHFFSFTYFLCLFYNIIYCNKFCIIL